MPRTPYKFSHNMIESFEGSAYRLFQYFRGRRIEFLEIGVFEGQTACHMLDNYLTHEDSGYTGIEIDPVRVALASANIICGGHSLSKWSISQGRSDQILAQWFDHSRGRLVAFDAIYIDGDHREDAVFKDATLSWPLLLKDGIMLFDDYLLEQSSLDPSVKFGVKEAVLRFMCTLDPAHYDIVLNDYQFAIKRRT